MSAGSADGRIASVCGAVLVGHDAADAAGARSIATLLDSLFGEVLLVGGTATSGAPGRAVPEAPGPRCALAGLVGALEATDADGVLVVGCDASAVTPALLLALVAWPEADVVAPRGAGGPQPLCALYRREAVLPLARARLREQTLDLEALLGAVETAYLEPEDLERLGPPGTALARA